MKTNLTSIVLYLFFVLAIFGFTHEGAVVEPKLIDAKASDIRHALNESGAKVIMLNIWATWCDPCREEFPDMMKLYRMYKKEGFDLILVSTDFESSKTEAIDFLVEQGVDFVSFRKNQTDQVFIESIHSEWNGAIPATIIYNEKREVVDFWVGKVDYEEFENSIRKHIN